jgi:hypothetical protein
MDPDPDPGGPKTCGSGSATLMVINLILPQLWEKHCHKDFRNKQREEMESWREMYERCTYEREEKLDQLKVHVRIIIVSGSNPSL